MKLSDFFKLLLFIAICQIAGLIGTIFTISSIPTWYSFLNKPAFSPPNFVFGPVWITLYTLMGISAFIIYEKRANKKNTKEALKIFGYQLALNSLWSVIFFGAKLPMLAFIEIVILWLAIVLTIINFYKISKPASYLLIPYLLWVSFASILNFYIAILN